MADVADKPKIGFMKFREVKEIVKNEFKEIANDYETFVGKYIKSFTEKISDNERMINNLLDKIYILEELSIDLNNYRERQFFDAEKARRINENYNEILDILFEPLINDNNSNVKCNIYKDDTTDTAETGEMTEIGEIEPIYQTPVNVDKTIQKKYSRIGTFIKSIIPTIKGLFRKKPQTNVEKNPQDDLINSVIKKIKNDANWYECLINLFIKKFNETPIIQSKKEILKNALNDYFTNNKINPEYKDQTINFICTNIDVELYWSNIIKVTININNNSIKIPFFFKDNKLCNEKFISKEDPTEDEQNCNISEDAYIQSIFNNIKPYFEDTVNTRDSNGFITRNPSNIYQQRGGNKKRTVKKPIKKRNPTTKKRKPTTKTAKTAKKRKPIIKRRTTSKKITLRT